MGNKNSAESPTAQASNNYTSPHNEEGVENHYTTSSSRPPLPPPLPHRTSPILPKRSYSVLDTKKDIYGGPLSSGVVGGGGLLSGGNLLTSLPQTSHSSSIIRSGSIPTTVRQHSTTSKTESDDLKDRVTCTVPESGAQDVSLGSVICVYFDKDVKTVNINKLFEVTCESRDNGEKSTVKGRISYDSKQMKGEFTPLKTLYPNSKINIRLSGKSITTTTCSQSVNIKDMHYTFDTANPAPKTVGIKLKDQTNTEQLQIANYYDLFNSLINWSSRKWGCSGEHVIGVYSEREGGKLVSLKSDLDILNIKDEEIIVIEIKD